LRLNKKESSGSFLLGHKIKRERRIENGKENQNMVVEMENKEENEKVGKEAEGH